jgi:uncharacterized cupin superfamily protein
MPSFTTVKLFDLNAAPDYVRDPVRIIANAHVSPVDDTAIWEVTVGSYEWQKAAEEWELHRWLKENGAVDGELVLVKLDGLTA